MKRRILGIAAVVVATAGAAVPTVSAADVAGPCRGESIVGWRMDALLVGRRSTMDTKLVVHVQSSQDGALSGELILGRGDQRMYVDSWCRLWGEDGESLHAIGVRTLGDGTRQFVRVDVSTGEGLRARVRTRPAGHGSGHDEGSGHSGWQTVTGEGWLTLTRARVGASGDAARWMRS